LKIYFKGEMPCTCISHEARPWFNCAFFLFLSLAITSSLASHDTNNERQAKNNSSLVERRQPSKMNSLAESILKSGKRNRSGSDDMKTYWQQTFAEIKDLKVFFPEQTPFLDRWKMFLEENAYTVNTTISDTSMQKKKEASVIRPETLARFDGFRSWDRILQEWKDDVADYIEKNTIASGSYPMSTLGRPPNHDPEADLNEKIQTTDGIKGKKSIEEASKPIIKLPEVELVGTSSSILKQFPCPRIVQPGEKVLPYSDLSDKSKAIWIVTTAALPWMTGTAVNPLLRAAYLTEGRAEAGGKVTLMLPWLEQVSDQKRVYGKDRIFDTPEDQEKHIRDWLRNSANLEQASKDLNIAWYTGRQEQVENSIYSMGDITALIPTEEVDICILEEPEHLNWYRAPGENWTTKFKHVIGIIHTNYFFYAQEQPAAFIRAPGMKLLCSWMCRCHCHRVIKLSGTLEKFAPEKELVENVHGVRATFLDIGEEVRQILLSPVAKAHPVFSPTAEPTVYFIGKMLWSKGLGSLMELLKYAEESADLKLHIDMYGGGPDKDAASMKSSKLGLDMKFQGPLDHAKLAFTHKIFVNPSTSEVLCTTVSEALAMGKFVVLPSHPSNDFFAQFPNCLPYSNKEEFVGNLYYALTHSPEPLTKEYAYALSWEAATKRLEAAGSISVQESEEMAAAVESEEAGVEIDLPPIVDDDEQRKKIASNISRSRELYRQFRSRLSEEIKQSKVLPKVLQMSLIEELDKRLDLDIEAILQSPKLRVQLSPAELDKRLLNFYNDVTGGPGGDVVRVISGGSVSVGRQHLYLKQKARKQRRRNELAHNRFSRSQFNEELNNTDENDRTPSQWVRTALNRNLPPKGNKSKIKYWNGTTLEKNRRKYKSKTKMSMMNISPFYRAPNFVTRFSTPLI